MTLNAEVFRMISNHQLLTQTTHGPGGVGALLVDPFTPWHKSTCRAMPLCHCWQTQEREREIIRLLPLRGRGVTATTATAETTTAVEASCVSKSARNRTAPARNIKKSGSQLTTEAQSRPAHRPPCPHRRPGACSRHPGHHGRHGHGRRISAHDRHPSCHAAGYGTAAA